MGLRSTKFHQALRYIPHHVIQNQGNEAVFTDLVENKVYTIGVGGILQDRYMLILGSKAMPRDYVLANPGIIAGGTQYDVLGGFLEGDHHINISYLSHTGELQHAIYDKQTGNFVRYDSDHPRSRDFLYVLPFLSPHVAHHSLFIESLNYEYVARVLDLSTLPSNFPELHPDRNPILVLYEIGEIL